MLKEIEINTPFITLGQFLKLTDAFESGGMIKVHLRNKGVYVNDQHEKRRGRKLYQSDIVTLENGEKYQVKEIS